MAESTEPARAPAPEHRARGREETVGNHVTPEVTPGRFLLYAHLKPGPLTFREGDHVEPGRVLGLIGNSGNSTTPHPHFQVMTTAEFPPTDSPPFTFRRFRVVGQVEPRIWDDNLGLQPPGALPITPGRTRAFTARGIPSTAWCWSSDRIPVGPTDGVADGPVD